jgi:hypothetical protein
MNKVPVVLLRRAAQLWRSMEGAMNQIEGIEPKSRRNPMRRWAGIEVAGYVLVCVFLVTRAWENNHLSGAVVFGAWLMAGLMLTLAFRGIYLRRRRR